MKRFFVAALSLVCLTALYGCSVSSAEGNVPQESAIGVIETKNNVEESRIVFFDQELNESYILPLNYGSINSVFYKPVVTNGILSVVPQGIANKKDGRAILCINSTNLSHELYRIDQPSMNAIATCEEYLYACNTLNGISYINRYDINTEEVKSIRLDALYTSFILLCDEYLCAFSSTLDNAHSQIDLFDKNLNHIDSIDSSFLGTGTYQAVEYEGEIYFTCLYSFSNNNKATIGVLDVNASQLEELYVDHEKPFGVEIEQSVLVISHYDIVNRAHTSSVTLIDLNTGDAKSYTLNHGMEQMALLGDKLYVLSNWNLYCYSLNDCRLIKQIKIESMDSDFSYITGLFHF